jgi:opacity protein-like surface antigen
MRRTILLFTLCWLAASAATAQHSVGFLGTYQDAKDGDAGYGGAVRYQWDMDPGADSLRWLAQAGYLTGFGDTITETYAGMTFDDEFEVDVIPLELAVGYDFPTSARSAAYVAIGVGYYLAEGDETYTGSMATPTGVVSVDIPSTYDVDNEIGFFALAGWEFGLSDQLCVFAEARYTELEVDGTSTSTYPGDPEPLVVSGTADLSGLGASIGLRWAW